MRRFNSSHVALAVAVLLCVTAYSTSRRLHSDNAPVAVEIPIGRMMQSISADDDEPYYNRRERRCACPCESENSVADDYSLIAKMRGIHRLNFSTQGRPR